MHSGRIVSWALLCWLSTCFYTGLASAQVYKWIDEDGNVQFGDKPLDPRQAENAQEVELKENYRPDVLTQEEQTAIEARQEANRRRYEAEQRAQDQANERAALEQQERTTAFCEASSERIRQLTSLEVNADGLRTRYYLEENGKSVSSRRQREILEELKAQRSAAGCP